MHLVADRKGKTAEENSLQDRFLGMLYGHAAGRLLLRPMVSPAVSRLGGLFLDSKLSKMMIPAFIRSHAIDMSEFEPKEYSSYNDFFTRRLRPGARCVEEERGIFVSPCDSRLSVCRISQNHVFSVKNTSYTVESLLKSKKLARAYEGGYVWVFRLCVDDYHRYIYVDDGTVGRNVRIPGVFHTVNPAANDQFPIYKENTREYCLVRSDNFGAVIQMEVGAMLVGKIENHPVDGKVKRGQEKGNFAFGGSTVILMTRRGAVRPDRDILRNSAKGIETKVRLGERVGIRGHEEPGTRKR